MAAQGLEIPLDKGTRQEMSPYYCTHCDYGMYIY